MKLGLFEKFIKKKKEDFIFYKIVESIDGQYELQCINTKSILYLDIKDIDYDLVYGLHPIQACFLGMQYADYLRHSILFNENRIQLLSRYGSYLIQYQDRERNICFIDKLTNQSHTIPPKIISMSNPLISEFDASQAFYIGIATIHKNDQLNLKLVK